MPPDSAPASRLGVDSLGGAGPLVPATCAAAAAGMLQHAAGNDLAMTSMTIEFSRVVFEDGDVLDLAVHVDKKTRAVAFVSLVASLRGAMVFSARGLFSPL